MDLHVFLQKKGRGMIFNTRPEFYRDRFHEAFASIGLPILDCPVLTPEPTGVALPAPDDFDSVIFTSQIAVAMFPARAEWQLRKVYAVGPGTADAVRAAGFSDVVCTGADAEDMEQRLTGEPFQNALYASAEDVSKDLSEVFPERVRRLSIYRMVLLADLPAPVRTTIEDSAEVILPLFSKRTAVAIAALLRKGRLVSDSPHICAVGISDGIFAVEEGPWHCRAVASSPTLDAMVAKTRDLAIDIGLISKVVR